MASEELLRVLLQENMPDDFDHKKETEKYPIGLRVVRGPDWKWDSQDSGEGHVGTVVEIAKSGRCPEKMVEVQWDSGKRHTYSIGRNDNYDLRILDNATLGINHPTVTCNSCRKSGIYGFRWKCRECYDFDLCSQCYMADKHDVTHTFLRRMSDSSSWVKIPKRRGAVKVQMRGIFPSAKVTRSTDWEWASQDGGPGKIGIVSEVCGASDERSGERNACYVLWSVTKTKNLYRVGLGGKVDVKYVEDAADGFYYREHLPVLGKPAHASEEIDNETVLAENIVNEKWTYKVDEVITDNDCENETVKESQSEKCNHKGFILLCQNMEELFHSGQFCDFTIKVKDHKFEIHKAVLGARSSVFAAMLQHDMKEKNSGIVDIKDCEPDIFRDFLFYLYSGKTERISPENVTGLYEAAEKYDIQELKEECANFMKENLSEDIFFDVMNLAVIYKDRGLTEQATEYFVSNAQDILLTVKWQVFMEENPVPANELYIKALKTVSKKK